MDVCWLARFKGVLVGVLGGPVVVTSDLAAHSRASHKPLQMHPKWKSHVPHTKKKSLSWMVGMLGVGGISGIITDTELNVHYNLQTQQERSVPAVM